MSTKASVEWVTKRADEIETILSRYPQKKSAIMPLFYLAQDDHGYVSDEDLEAIGEILGVTKAYAESVVSFYSLYHRKPVGKYVITVCSNITCGLSGAADLVKHLEERLGIKTGETTEDGLITLLTTGECIAACDAAPAIQVNLEYCNTVTPDRADGIIAEIRSGKTPEQIADKFGGCSLQPTAGFVRKAPAVAESEPEETEQAEG